MTLEDRIGRLERQNWLMKRVGGVAVVLVGLFLTLGQSKPQDEVRARTVEAQEFRLVDETGEVRSSWAAKDGAASLVFRGRAGLVFQNLKGQPAIFLGTALEGSDVVGNLLLHGHIRSAEYLLDDKNGATRSKWGVQDGVAVHLVLYDANKNATIFLTAADDGTASVALGADRKGSILFLSSNPPALLAKNKNGVAALGITETGPGFSLTDRKDTIVFKAP